MKIMTTAILATTLIFTEFAYVAHERAETESMVEATKLLMLSQAMRGPSQPTPTVRKPAIPGGAQLETL